MKTIKTKRSNSVGILRSTQNSERRGAKVRENQALGLFVPCLYLTLTVTLTYVQVKCVNKGANTHYVAPWTQQSQKLTQNVSTGFCINIKKLSLLRRKTRTTILHNKRYNFYLAAQDFETIIKRKKKVTQPDKRWYLAEVPVWQGQWCD